MKTIQKNFRYYLKIHYVKRNKYIFILLPIILFLIHCNEHYLYLQESTIHTNRKSPTITTSLGEHRLIDIEVSGGYSGKRPAKHTQGRDTTFISSDTEIDYDTTSDTNCDSILNNSNSGDNISLYSTQWNASLQLSLIPFYKEIKMNVYRLRVLAEAQYGKSEDSKYLNFKFGPTFSFVTNRFAVHPKVLIGASKIKAEYQAIIFNPIYHTQLLGDSSYYTYTCTPDSGEFESYMFFTEFGVTFELPIKKSFSILTDISATYQDLFDHASEESISLGYAEISPALKIGATKYLTILSGISIPFNPKMSEQLPIQAFAKIHISLGPDLGKR